MLLKKLVDILRNVFICLFTILDTTVMFLKKKTSLVHTTYFDQIKQMKCNINYI